MSDLYLLSPSAQEEPKPRIGRSVALAVALLLIAGAVAWLFVDIVQASRDEARVEAALGRSAHAAGDCGAADRHLKSALDSGTIDFLDAPVDRAALLAEIAACEELERARHLAGRGEHVRAIESFDEYLSSGSARYVHALDAQSGVRIALGEALENQGEEMLAVRQYAAVMAEAPGTDLAQDAEAHVWALYDEEVDSGREASPCKALDPARAWLKLEGEALEPVREAAHDTLSWSLLRCGEHRVARGQSAAKDGRYDSKTFDRARAAFAIAVEKYPDTKPGRLAGLQLDRLPGVMAQARSEAAEVAKERERVKRIKQQIDDALRSGDSLTRPRSAGDGGNEVRLTIRNATGNELYVAWTGTETDSTRIPAGGETCDKARTTTIILKPGDYEVATHEKGDWSSGSWYFPGKNFTTCIK